MRSGCAYVEKLFELRGSARLFRESVNGSQEYVASMMTGVFLRAAALLDRAPSSTRNSQKR
jgi:hypothetical protein